jgi:autotransporter-associated beta strand protein
LHFKGNPATLKGNLPIAFAEQQLPGNGWRRSLARHQHTGRMKLFSLPSAASTLLILTLPAAWAQVNLEAYFPLDDNLNAGAGTTYVATPVGVNEPRYTTGILGSAGDFANNDAGSTPSDWAITLGNLDALYQNDFSISLWVNTTSTGGGALIGNSNWLSGANTGWLLSTFTGGRQGKVKTSTGTRQNQTINLSTGTWRLITLVVDNTNDLAFWYMDGVALNGAGAPIGTGTLGAGLGTMIGGSGGGVECGTAFLDDVAIFSGKLNLSQILYLYNGGIGRTADQFNGAPVPKDITWTGAFSSEWSQNIISSPKNWGLTSNLATRADFLDLDTVNFTDSATTTNVVMSQGDLAPFAVRFTNATKNYTLTGSSALTGTMPLTKSGAGTVTLSSPQLHTGPSTVSGGTLVIDHPQALQNSTLTGSAAGGTTSFGTVTEATLGGLAGDANLVLQNATLQLVALTVGNNNNNTVFSGSLSGTGSLTKSGTGRLGLAGATTLSDSLSVAAGSLQALSPAAFPSLVTESTGGTIEFAFASGVETTLANNFLLPSVGAGVIRMFAVFGEAGAAPVPGTTVRMTGKISGGLPERTFRFSDTGITGEHDNILVLDNPGNDFFGTIEIYRASLAITSDAALGNPENDLIHFSENLSGKFRFDTDNIILNPQRTVSLPGAANARPFDTQAFTATIEGPVSGTGTLIKQGTGRLILASLDSTFSGIINVTQGTLQIDGLIPASTAAVTVTSGATLTGTGTIRRNITLTGGTLAPGPGIATLTGPQLLTLGEGANLAIGMADWTGTAGTGYDTISADSLTLTATALAPAIITLTPSALTNFTDAARNFTLVTTVNGITGFSPDLFVVDASALPQTSAQGWSVNVQDNDLVLVYAPSAGYTGWIAGKNLTGADAAFTADPDKDGIPNGIEFVLSSEPNPANTAAGSTALLPTVASDSTYLRFTYRRSTLAASANPTVQYDVDLAGVWTPAVNGQNGVVINTTAGIEPGIDRVEVLIPQSLAAGGKLFARLAATP